MEYQPKARGGVPLPNETIITWQAPPLRLGAGATDEIGYELGRLGVRSVLLVTDPTVVKTGLPDRVRALIEAEGIGVEMVDDAQVEPTDQSCQELARRLADTETDGFVAVGGGSSLDTAKVLNLLMSDPGVPLHAYLNKPIGEGRPVRGRLKPLVAVPTTAGSGSECTAMVALGVVELKVKTGIADRALTPSLAIVDPLNTLTMPPAVTASCGYDVLAHACESYTARAYDRRPRYRGAADRPVYIGANPISDIWAEQALRLIGEYFVRAVMNPDDLPARTAMAHAAVYAGMGFGNAGTHIPHASAYPIAGLVTGYRPRDYEVDHPMVPHGEAVIVTAPAAFRYTFPASPERHLRAAELLGATDKGNTGADALPSAIAGLIAATGGPAGVAAFGYGVRDIPALVRGAAMQERLLACCPRAVTPVALTGIFEASMRY